MADFTIHSDIAKMISNAPNSVRAAYASFMQYVQFEKENKEENIEKLNKVLKMATSIPFDELSIVNTMLVSIEKKNNSVQLPEPQPFQYQQTTVFEGTNKADEEPKEIAPEVPEKVVEEQPKSSAFDEEQSGLEIIVNEVKEEKPKTFAEIYNKNIQKVCKKYRKNPEKVQKVIESGNRPYVMLCNNYYNCKYGNKCCFAHSQEEVDAAHKAWLDTLKTYYEDIDEIYNLIVDLEEAVGNNWKTYDYIIKSQSNDYAPWIQGIGEKGSILQKHEDMYFELQFVA